MLTFLLTSDYPDGQNGVTLEGLTNLEYWLGGIFGWCMRRIAEYASYSWQVKFSVCLVIFGSLLVFYLLFRLVAEIRRRHIIRRMELDTYARLHESFLQVLECRDPLTEKDIENLCGMTTSQILSFPNVKSEKIAVRILASVIMRVRLEMIKKYEIDSTSSHSLVDHEVLYIPNVVPLCKMTRVTELYETNLEKRRDVIKTLQDMLTLTLPLTEGYLAIYTGHHNRDIKYMARMCHVFCTKAEPYKFMVEDLKGAQPMWYPMMLHRLLGWLKQTNHPMPKFTLLASETTNANSAAFLIREVGFWGDDAERERVYDFLRSSQPKCVEAALEVLGVRDNLKAETAIKDSYDNHPEPIRRECLKALCRIQSGESVEFFVNAFEGSSSQETKACALECLYTYGRAGLQSFINLSQKYASNESLSDLIHEVESIQIAKQAGFIM